MHVIDMAASPRRTQFEYFRTFADPYVGVTVPCDITRLRGACAAHGWPFFLTVLHCAVNAANAVPELRRRICGDQAVEYDVCPSSHTVALPDGSYCYCKLDCSRPLAEFLPYAQAEVARAKAAPSLDDGADAASLFFVTCLPWLSFTELRLPVPSPADSNPRISFGKFYAQEERILLPVNLTAHHALADGIHLALFFEGFTQRVNAL